MPALRLSAWPYVIVRIDCRLCPRKGCYRLARLAVRYGPDFEMDKLLAHLASDCPWWRSRPRKYEARCGARFVDLDRAALPDLPAGVETSVLRQRMPARENVPQRRRTSGSVALYRAPMLSGVRSAALILHCSTCGRQEELAVEVLLAGGDMRLTDLRVALTADCPRSAASEMRERCNTTLTEPEPPSGAAGMRVVA